MLWITPLHIAALEQGEFEEGDEELIHKLDEILDSAPWDRLAFNGFHRLIPMSDAHRHNYLINRIDKEFQGSETFSFVGDQTCPA